MKRIGLLILFLQVSCMGFSQNKIIGDWNGLLEVQGRTMRLSFHIMEEGETLTATMDSPDQGAFGIPVTSITFDTPELIIKMPKIGLTYTGKVNDTYDKIEGDFQQAGLNIPLALQREVVEKPIANRPQTPTEPFPYYTEEISFANEKAGITLAGTLSLPSQEGQFPIVILISGSGPQDRNSNIMDHKIFLVLADHLTRQGIGVLRYDDRGIGGSTGNFSLATSEDFASDVLAGVEYLKTRPEVKADQIGLVGHSEGGLIAPMVAVASADVNFMVLLAGPGVPGSDILLLQSRLISEADGKSETNIQVTENILKGVFAATKNSDDLEASKKEITAVYKKALKKLPIEEVESFGDLDVYIDQQIRVLTTPWFLYFFEYDPKTSLEKVTCPVLALNGEKDLQVDPNQNLPAIEAALKKAGNKHYEVKTLKDLNHLFQTDKTGNPGNYGKIEETFAPSALEEISSWILKVVR